MKKPCSCIGSTFLLNVSSPNKGVVLIHDLSDWVQEEGFVYPDIYLLDVIYPDGNVVEKTASPKNGWTFEVDPAQDGVYEFTLNNCGVVYTQKELITSNVECSLDIAIVKTDKERDFALIRDIQDDLMVAKSAAGIGNYESATKILELITRKMKNLSCDCSCKN